MFLLLTMTIEGSSPTQHGLTEEEYTTAQLHFDTLVGEIPTQVESTGGSTKSSSNSSTESPQFSSIPLVESEEDLNYKNSLLFIAIQKLESADSAPTDEEQIHIAETWEDINRVTTPLISKQSITNINKHVLMILWASIKKFDRKDTIFLLETWKALAIPDQMTLLTSRKQSIKSLAINLQSWGWISQIESGANEIAYLISGIFEINHNLDKKRLDLLSQLHENFIENHRFWIQSKALDGGNLKKAFNKLYDSSETLNTLQNILTKNIAQVIQHFESAIIRKTSCEKLLENLENKDPELVLAIQSLSLPNGLKPTFKEQLNIVYNWEYYLSSTEQLNTPTNSNILMLLWADINPNVKSNIQFLYQKWSSLNLKDQNHLLSLNTNGQKNLCALVKKLKSYPLYQELKKLTGNNTELFNAIQSIQFGQIQPTIEQQIKIAHEWYALYPQNPLEVNHVMPEDHPNILIFLWANVDPDLKKNWLCRKWDMHPAQQKAQYLDNPSSPLHKLAIEIEAWNWIGMIQDVPCDLASLNNAHRHFMKDYRAWIRSGLLIENRLKNAFHQLHLDNEIPGYLSALLAGENTSDVIKAFKSKIANKAPTQKQKKPNKKSSWCCVSAPDSDSSSESA